MTNHTSATVVAFRQSALLLPAASLIGTLLLLGFASPVKATQPPFADWLNYKADKVLTVEEATQIVELSLLLVNKDKPVEQRRNAAESIGLKMPHRAAVPALIQVIADNKDELRVRSGAITALSQVNDKSVIPLLISAFRYPDLRSRACEQLRKLYGYNNVPPFGLTPQSSEKEGEQVIKVWEDWWKMNEATSKPHRAMLLFE